MDGEAMGSVGTTGTETTTDTSTTTTSESTSTPSNNNASEFSNTSVDNADAVRLVVDDKGNRKMEFGTNNDVKQELNVVVPNILASETQSEQLPQPYTDAELMQAIQSNTVDQRRMTSAQVQHVNSIAQAMQAQAQAQAQQRVAMEKARAERIAADQKVFTQFNEDARNNAIKQLNLTQDQLDELDFMDDGDAIRQKLDEATQKNLMSLQENFFRQRINAENQAKEYTANLQSISEFCGAEKAKDANMFNNVLATLDHSIKKMPHEVATVLERAEQNILSGKCTRQDLELFKQAYNETKKAIFQNQRGVSKIPQRTNAPRVEHSGVPYVESTNYDFTKLGNLNRRDRATAVQQFFKKRIYG